MIKRFIFLLLPFLFINCTTTSVSTKEAIDISNSSSKIDIYLSQQKENSGKLELIENQNKIYTDKIKDLTDEAIKSNEYYINKSKIEGIEEGYNKGIEEQKLKDQIIINQLEKELNKRGVEINYVQEK